MSLLFMDGSDHYDADGAAQKYILGSASIVAGRHGNGVNFGHSLRAVLRGIGSAKIIIGEAVKFVGLPDVALWSIGNEEVTQLTFTATSDGRIVVTRFDTGNPVIAMSEVDIVRTNVWHFIEAEVEISDAAGTVKVWVDGALVIDESGLRTNSTLSASVAPYMWTYVQRGGTGSGHIADDFYVLDGAGSAPYNARLGDVEIGAIFPESAGDAAEWTPSGVAANWDAVDETDGPDGDATHNVATASGIMDLHTMQDVDLSGQSLFGMQLSVSARRTDEGFAVVAPIIKHDGVVYAGEGFALANEYSYRRAIWETQPGSGASAWDEDAINAIQAGYRRDY